MGEKVPKGQMELPAPEIVAAADQAIKEVVSGVTFIDLSAVPAYKRSVVSPQFSISYRGYVGQSSVRGAEEIKGASKTRKLAAPVPASLMISADNAEPRVLYGVPSSSKKPAFLALEWVEQNRVVRANFQAILRAKEIEIPQGMRMVIDVEQIQHKELGPCVKLSWSDNCLVPMNEGAGTEEEKES